MAKNIKSVMTPVKSSLFLAIGEKIYETIIGLVVGMIVIRCIEIEDYAVITTIGAYSTFIGFLNFSPENYLYKCFSKCNSEEITQHVKAYIFFDILNGGILFFLYSLIGVFLFYKSSYIGYLIIAIQNGIMLLIRQIYNVSRIVLELEYMQKKITLISIFVRTCSILLTFLLIFNKSLFFYAIISLITCMLEMILTYLGCKKFLVIEAVKKYSRKQIIIKSFKEYALVNHFSGVLTSIIYASDTMFLGWFCDMKTVGIYGIALGCINYSIAIFQILQKQTSIALGNSKNKKRDIEIVNKFTLVSVILAMIVVLGFVFWGKVVLKIYTGYQDVDTINSLYRYALIILIGVSSFNCVRPITSYINLRCSLIKYFTFVLIPIFALTMVTYFYSSKIWGGIGIAISNIIVYSIWSIIVIIIYIVNATNSKENISNL